MFLFLCLVSAVSLHASLRTSYLNGMDLFFEHVLPKTARFFTEDPHKECFVNTSEEIISFDERYGYFSSHPIVAKVTKEKEDRELAGQLLFAIGTSQIPKMQKKLMVAEVIAKVIAYRDWEEGMELCMVTEEGEVVYRVDKVFNLWHGIPAFGFVPLKDTAAPLLVFRGTDPSLHQARGWASIASDIDISGVGYTLFTHARPYIRAWLEKVAQKGKKARVIGYSLGGSLAAYTALFEQEWISALPEEESYTFNAPGFSQQLLYQINENAALMQYITQGDPISHVGTLSGCIHILSLDKPLKPLSAHMTLMTTQATFCSGLISNK